jgi:uncharacterized protein
MELFIPDLKKADGRFINFRDTVEISDPDRKTTPSKAPLLEITLQAAYAQNRVFIKGSWQAELRGECSRCLAETAYTLKETFSDEFVHLQPGEPDNDACADDEQLVFRGDQLKLDGYFLNAYIIGQPLKILCSEDCMGLCPVCGQDRNKFPCSCADEQKDERWAQLGELLGQKDIKI